MDALKPCPDSALLAAFIDGTLADYERTAVVTHLSECPQCRAVALTVVDFREVTASDQHWHQAALAPPALVPRPRVRRWAREKTRAPALALAAVATIAAVAIPVFFILPSWSSDQAISTLVTAVEGHRPLEARVAGGFHYATAYSDGQVESSGPWQLIAAAGRIRETHENNYGVPSRKAIGVAALLVGQLDDAVTSLTIAAAGAPPDSRLANDLAAAYYERSQRGSRADDLPAALDAVERAVAGDPTLTEAWFNRALILTALGMRLEAQAAWQVYLSKDSSSPWAEEARSRLQALDVPATSVDWGRLRDTLVADSDPAAAQEAVTHHAGRARDLFENVLLKTWLADATLGRNTSASTARLVVLADAFETVSGDHFYRDFVRSLETAVAEGGQRRAAFVRAHQQFLEAMAVVTAGNSDLAAEMLDRAGALLVSVKSPFAVRARLEHATTAYARRVYDEAAANLTTGKYQARARGYRALTTRAAWILGMTEFGRNDLAAAQVEYEEMLDLATDDTDPDTFVMAHVLLANLHDALGDNERAWYYRIRAAAKAADCRLQSTLSNLYLGSAGHALASGHLATALMFQTRLLSSPHLNPLSEVQTRVQRASAWVRLGEHEAAKNEIAAARARLGLVPDSRIRSRVAADLLAVESEVVQSVDPVRALALAEQAITVANDPNDLVRQSALQIRLAEAAVANGLSDRADRAAADAVTAIDTFRASAADDVGLGASSQATSVYARATEIALLRGDVPRAFDYSERRRIQTTRDLRSPARGLHRLESIQQELDPDTALAVLTQVGDKLQVWLIRRNGVGTHRSALNAQRAAGLVAAHLDEIRRGVVLPVTSGDLYDELFRPMQRLLAGATNMVVVSDTPYSRIAFAGLWDRRRGRFLVEDYKLAAAPSATAYVAAVARARSEESSPQRRRSIALAMGAVPVGTQHDDTLATALAAAYSAGPLRQDAATPETVVRDIAERDVVHIAASVVANEQFPGRSRLLMVDVPRRKYSGAVSARQLATPASVRARLIALQTPPERRGNLVSEGVSGFATALLAYGVPTVVGPVAQMPDSHLERAWLDFHRHYAAGTTAAQSLRLAQLAALDDSKRRTGPWATLTVFGSTE